MTAAVLTPFHGAPAVELGNRTWRKKVLPIGNVEYQGRILRFTKDYLGQLVTAFKNRAYDQVPFQLADARNTHTNDPERTRGEITGMELGDDGLYVTAQLTPDGERVLTSNPRLGVSARIVEDYARSDGLRFPAAIQHVLGTLDPRIPGLGAWQAIEASNVPSRVLDLSQEHWDGDPIDLDWATWDADHGSTQGLEEHEKASATASRTARRDAMAKGVAGHDRGGSDEEKAANHLADGRRAAAQGNQMQAMQHFARATQLSSNPDVYAQASKLSKGAKQMAMQAGNTSASSWTTLSNEGTDDVAGLSDLTETQRQRLEQLLDLPDDILQSLAAGGVVLSPDELAALADGGGDDEMSEEELENLIATAGELDDAGLLDGDTWNTVDFETQEEGEPVGASLSAEAQFAIDFANSQADETRRELAVVTARLREEDYRAERRRLADAGIPPHITDLARPLLEGTGHTVELANGQSVDAGAIMRRVLTEYAAQHRLLDLGAELGSPMDDPGEEYNEAEVANDRADFVSRYRAQTGL